MAGMIRPSSIEKVLKEEKWKDVVLGSSFATFDIKKASYYN